MSFEVLCKSCGSVNVGLSIKNSIHIWGECLDCKSKSAINQRQTPENFRMPFGKYKGYSVAEIVDLDRNYAMWLVGQESMKPNIKEKFIEAMECF